MSKAYYNEFDPFASSWLKELIREGHIADGDVDDRSISDVTPNDLSGYTQCHFFAGIGVWSYALRLAGWSDDRPVWTGSCPCQPFSSAGKRKGFKDERHLWPQWFRLLQKCRPDAVFGEQVGSKDGLAWLDIVSADLEKSNYSVGACSTIAAGFGAPHLRQRLYFVGDSGKGRQFQSEISKRGSRRSPGKSGKASPKILADSTGARLERPAGESVRRDGRRSAVGSRLGGGSGGEAVERESYWEDCEWLSFRDGKRRPVEPGTFPLVNGSTNRVGRLRGYGNAICAPQAQGFIEAFLEVEKDGQK